MELDMAYGEELEDIPYAVTPDLISTLLSFDVSELAGGDERPEDMLVRKACEMRRWKIEGSHPRFLIDNWIEIVVTGRLEGYCRVINSRSHAHLKPFTLDGLLKLVTEQKTWIARHVTADDFVGRLCAAYDELDEGSGEPVYLHALYRLLNTRQPAYRREAFGLDLSRSLSKGLRLMGRKVVLSYAGGGEAIQRYALCLHAWRTAQLADQIQIAPTGQLKSLDI